LSSIPINLNQFTRRGIPEPTSRLIIFCHETADPALIDAKTWLERELWQKISNFNPKAQLTVVERYENDSDNPSISEIYEPARLAIFPVRLPLLKSARFLAEAMAMGLPCVITSAVLQSPVVQKSLPGLKLGEHYVRADTAESFAALAGRLLDIKGPGQHLAKSGRDFIEKLLTP
jgi:hypothetical protein